MEETTAQNTSRRMYLAGLTARMTDYADGNPRFDLAPLQSESPLVRAFAEGFDDAEDDSDEPRPDDPACLAVD